METLAACHLHSTWSYDGKWPLESLRQRFENRGCRVLLMTEHDRGFTPERHQQFRDACAQASTANVLVMPGIEYSDAGNRIHVLVWGTPFLGEGLPTLELLEAVHKAGGAAVLAHPTRRDAWRCFQDDWADRLTGIELWNRKYDGWAPSRTAGALLKARSLAVPFVGLDFHTRRQSFPLAMVLDVEGDITEESVVRCLKARRCYGKALGMVATEANMQRAVPFLNVLERARRVVGSLLRSSKPFVPPRNVVREGGPPSHVERN